MKPVKFKSQNIVMGENQSEYLPLPAHRSEDGIVTSCWELDDEEIAAIIKSKRIRLEQHTFNQSALQPVKLSVEMKDPEEWSKEVEDYHKKTRKSTYES
jgi:hypothetical protein